MPKKTTTRTTTMRAGTNPLGRPLLKFLEELSENNDREWFATNKSRYEEDVRRPAQAFIAAFSGPLARISSCYDADPRPVGGSMFRIYRDTRFATDKSPYKTFVGMHFRHSEARNVHAPGFYLHLEPGHCFLGAGLWRPPAPEAKKVRELIITDPAGWKRITQSQYFTRVFRLRGESLKLPPRGFDPEHRFVEDLKRKEFVAVHELEDDEVVAADFPRVFAKRCKTAAPFVELLCCALGLDF